MFEALRRHSFDVGQEAFAKGACFHSLEHETPARLDFYRARIVDGLGHVIHERLFTVELSEGGEPSLREPDIFGNLNPASTPGSLPPIVSLPEATAWLNENAFTPFIDEVRAERLPEVERVADHVELSLTEVLLRTDQEIGRATEDVADQVIGAEGRLVQAEARHDEAMARRERRRRELSQQRALTLQGVERLTSVLVLPHPGSEAEDVRRLRPNVETEMTAMRVVMEYEAAQERQVTDVPREEPGIRRDQPRREIRAAAPDRGEGVGSGLRHDIAHSQRTPGGRRSQGLLLALRGDQLCSPAGTSGADSRPRPVPLA